MQNETNELDWAVDVNTVKGINKLIEFNKKHNPEFKENDVFDGYHTFAELYEFRKMYNATLFNEWATQRQVKSRVVGGTIATGEYGADFKVEYEDTVKYNVHKSWKHHDGELCFGGGWFIVSAMLPTGLISNHYKAKDWDLFRIPETEKALFPFDGHTGKNVIERLKQL